VARVAAEARRKFRRLVTEIDEDIRLLQK